MDMRSFRFLHAADFRLDTPCLGVPDLPPDLRPLFVDARYATARRVFDTAIAREVGLSGSLSATHGQPTTGPAFNSLLCRKVTNEGIYRRGAELQTN